MKIVVLVKEVPDTYGNRKLSLETGLADRAATEAVLDEIGERALEVALTYADDHPDTSVTVLMMAPEGATGTLRKTLAMGATSAVHIADERLTGADLGLTAEILAAAITRLGFDLVVTGNLSTDGSAGVLPAMVAEHLGVPHLTSLAAVQLTANGVRGTRSGDNGILELAADLPALISVTEALPDARFATFKGIMAAKKKSLESFTAADLGIDPDDAAAARSIIVAISERGARAAGIRIVDEGDAGQKIADYLVQHRLV